MKLSKMSNIFSSGASRVGKKILRSKKVISRALKKTHYYFVVIFLVYFLVVFLSFRETYLALGEDGPVFCLSGKCIEEIKTSYKGVLDLAEGLGWATTILVTMLGAYIAFLSHVTSVKNSHISNHISHFNLFSDYLNREIKKRKSLSESKIDIFSWYNFMFPLSRKGDLSVSEKYLIWIYDVKDVIVATSERVSSKKLNINHNIHQRKMSFVLAKSGVNLETLPRRNFYAVEEELIELIDSVNLMFIGSRNLISELSRSYAV